MKIKEISRADDVDSLEGLENKQIFVAGDDIFGVSRQGGPNNLVVVRITTYWLGECLRDDNFHSRTKKYKCFVYISI